MVLLTSMIYNVCLIRMYAKRNLQGNRVCSLENKHLCFEDFICSSYKSIGYNIVAMQPWQDRRQCCSKVIKHEEFFTLPSPLGILISLLIHRLFLIWNLNFLIWKPYILVWIERRPCYWRLYVLACSIFSSWCNVERIVLVARWQILNTISCCKCLYSVKRGAACCSEPGYKGVQQVSWSWSYPESEPKSTSSQEW